MTPDCSAHYPITVNYSVYIMMLQGQSVMNVYIVIILLHFVITCCSVSLLLLANYLKKIVTIIGHSNVNTVELLVMLWNTTHKTPIPLCTNWDISTGCHLQHNWQNRQMPYDKGTAKCKIGVSNLFAIFATGDNKSHINGKPAKSFTAKTVDALRQKLFYVTKRQKFISILYFTSLVVLDVPGKHFQENCDKIFGKKGQTLYSIFFF